MLGRGACEDGRSGSGLLAGGEAESGRRDEGDDERYARHGADTTAGPAGRRIGSVGQNAGMSPATTTDAKRDAALLAAVDVARQAAVEDLGPDIVGEHIEAAMEGERLATHTFECLNPAYVGWHCAVSVSRAPRAKVVTVNDVVLVPGATAIVAPAWLPWNERVRKGDLGPGDVLPAAPDDVRLVAGLTDADDLEGLESQSPLRPGAWEIGLGRLRVLSPVGRDDAADRWTSGDFGPTDAMAKQSSGECGTCGFMLPIGGPLGQLFALCANDMSPADGRVVTLTYGCGAHSEVELEAKPVQPAADSDWDPLELGHS